MHRPNLNTKRKYKGLRSFKGIGVYLEPLLSKIIFIIILAIASAAFVILSPRILGDLVTKIQIDYNLNLGMDFAHITVVGMQLIFMYGFSALCSYACGFITTSVTQKLAYDMRKDISTKINKLPLSYFDRQSYGDVLSRVTNDVDTISENINQGLTQIITSITMIIGILIMMFTINIELAFISLASIPLSLFLMIGIIIISQKFFKAQQKSLGILNGHVEEMYGAHLVVKSFNGEDRAIEKFDKINQDLYRSAWKSQFLSGMMHPIIGFIGNIGYIFIGVYGGIKAISGQLMIGDITSFIQYFRQFSQPQAQIAQITNLMQGAAAASERVFEFLHLEEMENEENKMTLKEIKGEIEFKNVFFGYDPDKMIIKDFSCKIKPGQKVAIVGPTGAGKTTIVNLLMRFYEINQGEILIDGIDIRKMYRESVHTLFGMVLQDTWLFQGTIRENLKYGCLEASDEEMIKMSKAAHVDHFINSLPKAYDMVLDETAAISGGQKQLLTIARAMIRNAPMLILDEATSNVDTRTENLIQSAMEKLTIGRTSFVIAHRLSTIQKSDIILVMKDGNIIEMGKHAELLENKGFYAELYLSQFSE